MEPLEVSRWLKIPLLLSVEELQELLSLLSPFHLYPVGRVLPVDQREVAVEDFVKEYSEYVRALKNGEALKPITGVALSKDPEAIQMKMVKEGSCLNHPTLPFIHIQPHRFSLSTDRSEFLSMMNGKDAISFGIQFSYPQLYRDRKSLQIIDGYKRGDLPNTVAFKALQKWVRSHTIPTPFLLDGKRKVSIFRLGPGTFSWINNHSGLKTLGIAVDDRDFNDRK